MKFDRFRFGFTIGDDGPVSWDAFRVRHEVFVVDREWEPDFQETMRSVGTRTGERYGEQKPEDRHALHVVAYLKEKRMSGGKLISEETPIGCVRCVLPVKKRSGVPASFPWKNDYPGLATQFSEHFGEEGSAEMGRLAVPKRYQHILRTLPFALVSAALVVLKDLTITSIQLVTEPNIARCFLSRGLALVPYGEEFRCVHSRDDKPVMRQLFKGDARAMDGFLSCDKLAGTHEWASQQWEPQRDNVVAGAGRLGLFLLDGGASGHGALGTHAPDAAVPDDKAPSDEVFYDGASVPSKVPGVPYRDFLLQAA